MSFWIGRTRRWGLVVAALFSVLAGLGLVFRFVTPDAIGGLTTAQLVGLLALFVLPAATMGLLLWDSRVVRESRGVRTASPDAVAVVRAGESGMPAGREAGRELGRGATGRGRVAGARRMHASVR